MSISPKLLYQGSAGLFLLSAFAHGKMGVDVIIPSLRPLHNSDGAEMAKMGWQAGCGYLLVCCKHLGDPGIRQYFDRDNKTLTPLLRSGDDAQVLLYPGRAIDTQRYPLHARRLVNEPVRQLGLLASQVSSGHDYVIDEIDIACRSSRSTAPVGKWRGRQAYMR